MAHITWIETSTVVTALLDGVPVCTLKPKDIGGFVVSWLDGRLWAPPSHLPKAAPQQTRFFVGMDEARLAIEQHLLSL